MSVLQSYDAIVIGAGPAGMMAAICAAERHKKILLIERNNTPGAKLLITGGGRCNLTNTRESREFLNSFYSSRDFLRNSFARFFNNELLSFFQASGIVFKTEEEGCVFPVSDKAVDILNALKSKLQKNNVEIIYGERVRKIILKDKCVAGVLTYSDKYFSASCVVVATGGVSYPETGSSGDGYSLAKVLGHTIVQLKPALVPVIIKDKFIKDWQGISFKNVRVTAISNAKKIAERIGPIVFTHFGISGPIILDMSSAIYDALENKNTVELSINFMPDLDQKGLDALVLRELKNHSAKTLKNILKSILPKSMVDLFLERCALNSGISAHQVTLEQRKKLIVGLSGFRLAVKGLMPIKNGIVTRGGVDTKEINPKTLESKLIKGLFFAGEVIDVDATTGGYNLQAAFSTGWVAGNNI
ncbi:MAG: NAD(P)/FAD-dependent oxidoreductase [Candidatus Omnitrophota bacterium]|jgi:hypothetical protein